MNHYSVTAAAFTRLERQLAAGDLETIAKLTRRLVRVARAERERQRLARNERVREARLRSKVRHWLRSHPQAWAGWPRTVSVDPLDLRARRTRLVAAGCPGDLAEAIHAADDAVAELRERHREVYRRRVNSLDLGAY